MIDSFGIELKPPTGWDARIYQRDDPDAPFGAVLTAANFNLSDPDDDSATQTRAQLPDNGVVINLLEYYPATPVFFAPGALT